LPMGRSTAGGWRCRMAPGAAKSRRVSRKSVGVSGKSVRVSHSACEAGGRPDASMGAQRGRGPPTPGPRGAAWPSPAMSPIGAHRTRRHYRRPAATSDQRHAVRATSCQVPLPAPPAVPPGRGHRFPGSHGPTEQKVKEPWLTLRCHPKSSAPTIAPPAMSRMPKEPERRWNPANPRPQHLPVPGAPHAREFAQAHARRRSSLVPVLVETPKEPKSRRNQGEFALWRGGSPAPGARSAASILAPCETAMLENRRNPRAAEIQVNPPWCRDERTRRTGQAKASGPSMQEQAARWSKRGGGCDRTLTLAHSMGVSRAVISDVIGRGS
jgi:hypothetical protein